MAVLYAREGADVAIAFLPQEQSDAEETRRAVEAAGRRCLLLPGDLTRREFCDRVVDETVKAFGKLDILVSNAAHQNRKQSLDEVTDDEFDRTFRTNIYAFFYLARAALRLMKEGAVIVATSSETGILGSKNLPDYSATKGAINAFVKAMGAGADRAQDPHQRGRARAGLDAAQSVGRRIAARGRGEIRLAEPDGTSCAAGGTRAGLRIPRVECRFVVHHRHRPAGDGRGDDRRIGLRCNDPLRFVLRARRRA